MLYLEILLYVNAKASHKLKNNSLAIMLAGRTAVHTGKVVVCWAVGTAMCPDVVDLVPLAATPGRIVASSTHTCRGNLTNSRS